MKIRSQSKKYNYIEFYIKKLTKSQKKKSTKKNNLLQTNTYDIILYTKILFVIIFKFLTSRPSCLKIRKKLFNVPIPSELIGPSTHP